MSNPQNIPGLFIDQVADIDVVILSLNRLVDTLAAISSIKSQESVRPILWVVDQGSSKPTLERLREVAKADCDVQLIELGKNLGVAAGRNRGMSLGSANYIVSLDNDAVFSQPTALKAVVERFQADEGLAAIGFRIQNYWSGEYDRGSWVYPRSQWKLRDQPFLTTRFCGAGHAIRREALHATAMYDEALFFYWEELDLSYQLIAAGYTIMFDPEIVILHKISQEARRSWTGDRFYYLVRNAIYLDYKYFRSPGRVLMRMIGYLLKGLVNGVVFQAVKGVAHSLLLIRDQDLSQVSVLDERTNQYLIQHEMLQRGSLFQRLRDEVFETLH